MLKEKKMSSNTMQKITRFLQSLLMWIGLLVFLGVLFYAFLLKPIAESMLEFNWGVDVSIGSFRMDFGRAKKPKLILEDIKVGNPYGFPKDDSLQITRAVIPLADSSYDKKTWKPQRVDLWIKKVNLMRRVSGHLNLEMLVQAEHSRNKKRIQIAPAETHFYIEDLSETDASGPLLKKSELSLKNQETIISEKRNFREVMSAFTQDLLQKFEEESPAVDLPAPEYKGIVSVVEENLRDQAQKVSEDHAELVDSQ